MSASFVEGGQSFLQHSANMSYCGSVTADFTRANISLLQDDDPGSKAAEFLFEDFMNCLLTYPSQHQVLDLLVQYEDLCERETEILKKIVARLSGQTRFSKTIDTLRTFEKECCCWRLLRLLSCDRLNYDVSQLHETKDLRHKNDIHRSHKELEKQLYDMNRQYRELKLVIAWCEQNAADSLSDSSKLLFFADKLFLWDHTLQRGLDARLRNTVSDCTCMDPDASFRTPLHSADKSDEDQFIRLVFAYVRSGQFQKAVDLCAHCGQSWRASILLGGQLFDDSSNFAEASDDFSACCDTVLEDPFGNYTRDLWKTLCWEHSCNPKLSGLERATYGAISGCLSSVLPVCTTWQDYLWAFATAAAENKLDEWLRQSFGSELAPLPASLSNQADLNIAEIFEKIEAVQNNISIREATDPFHAMEKFIILGDAQSAVRWAHSFITYNSSSEDLHHLLRFMTHLILAFRLLGWPIDDAKANEIISLFITSLIESRRTSIIATYCSTLPENLQIQLYCQFLKDVQTKSDRRQFLQLAQNACLPVDKICKAVVDLLISKTLPTPVQQQLCLDAISLEWLECCELAQGDALKCNAIEWLLFDDRLRSEALRQANALARRFLATRKYVAAKMLFEKVPSDSVAIATFRFEDNLTMLPKMLASIVHEHQCIRAYLDAHESFVDWLRKFATQKPQAPGDPLSLDYIDRNFVDKVADEQRRRQFDVEYNRWKHTTSLCAETTLQQLTNVLLFPDGWMVDDSEPVDDADRNRLYELSLVRQQCIPLICSMMMKIYTSMERYRDAGRLADIIANEDHTIYKHLSKSALRDFLTKLVSCSVVALDSKMDAFGFEKP